MKSIHFSGWKGLTDSQNELAAGCGFAQSSVIVSQKRSLSELKGTSHEENKRSTLSSARETECLYNQSIATCAWYVFSAVMKESQCSLSLFPLVSFCVTSVSATLDPPPTPECPDNEMTEPCSAGHDSGKKTWQRSSLKMFVRQEQGRHGAHQSARRSWGYH